MKLALLFLELGDRLWFVSSGEQLATMPLVRIEAALDLAFSFEELRIRIGRALARERPGSPPFVGLESPRAVSGAGTRSRVTTMEQIASL